MQTPNRDMFATGQTQDEFNTVAPLLVSPELDQEFKRRNASAIRAKRQYHRFGQIAIAMVAMSAIFTIAEALVLPDFPGRTWLQFVAVSMAGLGIALQLYLIITKKKLKWLIDRFASERLRSLKFQAYALAQQARDTNDLQTRVEQFHRKEVARLENELNAGIAILRNFSPSQMLESVPCGDKPANPSLAAKACEAYMDLRINYQRNFALSQIAAFTGRRRLFNSTQDMIYLAAAIFTFLSLGSKLVAPGVMGQYTAWIDFLAVTFFVLGATEAIMDNALLEEQSQTRFEQYARDIEEVKAQCRAEPVNLCRNVRAMEQLCLNELDHFCRAADRISYRF